jgi:hypothetical protein
MPTETGRARVLPVEPPIADENLAAAVGSRLFTPLCRDLSTDQLDDAVPW